MRLASTQGTGRDGKRSVGVAVHRDRCDRIGAHPAIASPWLQVLESVQGGCAQAE